MDPLNDFLPPWPGCTATHLLLVSCACQRRGGIAGERGGKRAWSKACLPWLQTSLRPPGEGHISLVYALGDVQRAKEKNGSQGSVEARMGLGVFLCPGWARKTCMCLGRLGRLDSLDTPNSAQDLCQTNQGIGLHCDCSKT